VDARRLRDCLGADVRRLREVAAVTDLQATVPSCPGWTLADLVRHVGRVYLHKVECMRLGRNPEPWPPEGLDDEPPVELLDRAYGALNSEFASRQPGDPAFTWYPPDQTVGFWIRRMAHETVVHRVDAELAAGSPVDDIPTDLAADGVDEVLVTILQYETATWPEDYVDLLASAGDRAVDVVTPQRSWRVRLGETGVQVTEPGDDTPGAAIGGSAPELLLWLWNRGGEHVTTTGDDGLVRLLRDVLAASTQ
jgi:uncharacterized protein (TIGR03083 family)